MTLRCVFSLCIDPCSLAFLHTHCLHGSRLVAKARCYNKIKSDPVKEVTPRRSCGCQGVTTKHRLHTSDTADPIYQMYYCGGFKTPHRSATTRAVSRILEIFHFNQTESKATPVIFVQTPPKCLILVYDMLQVVSSRLLYFDYMRADNV